MNRVINLTIRLTIQEREQLQEKANKTGRKITTYIRETALGKKLHEKPSEEFIVELKNIRKIQSDINYLIKVAHIDNDIDSKVLKEVNEKMNNFVKDIRHKYIGGDYSGNDKNMESIEFLKQSNRLHC
jgi:predicted DNA-binding protein